ncbi:MAG: nucleoside-diphosphate kinase [Candidatus Nanoarchaeia archaeon]|nr:nucleoside-diphosphate kinase [Candidatus Nanoarchaeia archaeon]
MIEQSLVLIKPDGVERGLIGEVINRFERRGMKITALKMVWADENLAMKHYTDDITKRRGEKVRNMLVKFITEGPIVAMVVEGADAVEVVRKIVGATEPKSALPGTIRGDYCHISFSHADSIEVPIKNVIHSSGNAEEAKQEISIWFKPQEILDYMRVEELITIGRKAFKKD